MRFDYGTHSRTFDNSRRVIKRASTWRRISARRSTYARLLLISNHISWHFRANIHGCAKSNVRILNEWHSGFPARFPYVHCYSRGPSELIAHIIRSTVWHILFHSEITRCGDNIQRSIDRRSGARKVRKIASPSIGAENAGRRNRRVRTVSRRRARARAEYDKPSAHTAQVRAVFEQLRAGRKAAFLSPLHRASVRRREREMAKPW